MRRDELIEKYLLGQLGEADRDAFELHYFECASCFEDLQAVRALRGELARRASAIQAEPLRAGAGWGWYWAPALLGAAAAVVLAVWLWPGRIPTGPPPRVATSPPPTATSPEPVLAELARLEPPAYTPVVLRGAADQATRRFREAMRHYQKGDYAAAIPGLREAVRLNPAGPDARFFLGACYLLTGSNEEAVSSLRATVSLGDTPYLEDAKFYLAKAYLHRPDAESARAELLQVVALRGEREQEARALLARLDEYLQQEKGARR